MIDQQLAFPCRLGDAVRPEHDLFDRLGIGHACQHDINRLGQRGGRDRLLRAFIPAGLYPRGVAPPMKPSFAIESFSVKFSCSEHCIDNLA